MRAYAHITPYANPKLSEFKHARTVPGGVRLGMPSMVLDRNIRGPSTPSAFHLCAINSKILDVEIAHRLPRGHLTKHKTDLACFLVHRQLGIAQSPQFPLHVTEVEAKRQCKCGSVFSSSSMSSSSTICAPICGFCLQGDVTLSTSISCAPSCGSGRGAASCGITVKSQSCRDQPSSACPDVLLLVSPSRAQASFPPPRRGCIVVVSHGPPAWVRHRERTPCWLFLFLFVFLFCCWFTSVKCDIEAKQCLTSTNERVSRTNNNEQSGAAALVWSWVFASRRQSVARSWDANPRTGENPPTCDSRSRWSSFGDGAPAAPPSSSVGPREARLRHPKGVPRAHEPRRKEHHNIFEDHRDQRAPTSCRGREPSRHRAPLCL